MFNITPSMQAYWDTHPEPKASNADIAKIESDLGVTLPAPYTEFISTYGFVIFGLDKEEREHFEYYQDFPHLSLAETGNIAFLIEADELVTAYKYCTNAEYEGDETTPYFPPNYLPVGNDKGQGLILLELAPENGRVWYWPEREWAWGTEDNTWLGYVADNFYDFINGLHP